MCRLAVGAAGVEIHKRACAYGVFVYAVPFIYRRSRLRVVGDEYEYVNVT